jgi:transposase
MAAMLERQVEELKKSNKAKDELIASQAAKIQHLQFELMLALHRMWSRSSEKFEPLGPLLFDELAPQDLPQTQEPSDENTDKKTQRRGRKPLSPKLPRKEHLHELSEAERMCQCGNCMVKIGEDVSEKMAMAPAQVWVERHIYSKYACPNAQCPCAVDESRPGVLTAAGPLALIPRSIVTAGLLAHIWIAKFCDHLPFYRQEAGFRRIEADLSRQDMVNWTMRVAGELEPLMELVEETIREGPVIQMDETPVTVLQLNETGKHGQGYMWLARGGTETKKAVRYRFAPGRGSKHAKNLLGTFRGYLQSDAFGAYDVVGRDGAVIQVGCWAHARRKFFEAQKIAPANLTRDAIGRIKKLYQLEDDCRERAKTENLSDEAFLELRKDAIAPYLEELKLWFHATAAETLPSGPAGKALAYTVGQWDKLVRFLDHPWLTPDNNRAENSIRPFVVGRKNWLFHGNEEGAEAACRVYTLIETAKLNGLEPWIYLKDLLEKLPAVRLSRDWESLLPWNFATGKN